MSVYVGIDVHRKRSQVAVVAEDGTVQLNKNVVNGSEPFLRLIGDLPRGRRWRSRPHSAGAGWPDCWKTAASTRTWCTRCGARRSPRRG
jgi:hypothetical protein